MPSGAQPSVSGLAFTAVNDPWDLQPDGAGNMWISNSVLPLVYKVRIADGKLLATYTLTKSSLPLFESFDNAGNLWVMMTGATNNDGVQVMSPAGTVIGTYETAADTVSAPAQVVFDGVNMWIWSTGIASADGILYKMSLAGVVAGHYTGIAQQGYSDARNVAYDGAGSIWMTDVHANLYRVNTSTIALTTLFSYGFYPDPNLTSVLLGPVFAGGSLWLNDGQGIVLMINPATGALIKQITAGRDPNPMASDGTRLWLGNQADGSVTILNLVDGSLVGNFTTNVGANNWNQMSYDGAGNMWASTYNNTLFKFTLSVPPPFIQVPQTQLRFIPLPFCVEKCA